MRVIYTFFYRCEKKKHHVARSLISSSWCKFNNRRTIIYFPIHIIDLENSRRSKSYLTSYPCKFNRASIVPYITVSHNTEPIKRAPQGFPVYTLQIFRAAQFPIISRRLVRYVERVFNVSTNRSTIDIRRFPRSQILMNKKNIKLMV